VSEEKSHDLFLSVKEDILLFKKKYKDVIQDTEYMEVAIYSLCLVVSRFVNDSLKDRPYSEKKEMLDRIYKMNEKHLEYCHGNLDKGFKNVVI
jgi:hypothetical protein